MIHFHIFVSILNELTEALVQIENMDALFEAQFSPLADSGRLLSKCGKCTRYMKYISTQPPQLYCATCEEVYYLPQNGTIKVSQCSCSDSRYIVHWKVISKEASLTTNFSSPWLWFSEVRILKLDVNASLPVSILP